MCGGSRVCGKDPRIEARESPEFALVRHRPKYRGTPHEPYSFVEHAKKHASRVFRKLTLRALLGSGGTCYFSYDSFKVFPLRRSCTKDDFECTLRVPNFQNILCAAGVWKTFFQSRFAHSVWRRNVPFFHWLRLQPTITRHVTSAYMPYKYRIPRPYIISEQTLYGHGCQVTIRKETPRPRSRLETS